MVFAAIAVGRADDLLSASTAWRRMRWAHAAIVFAGGDHAHSADLYREIGSLPAEAYARLCPVTRPRSRALEFYRSVGDVPQARRGRASGVRLGALWPLWP
jgi:hypothetical protein